MLSDWRWDQHQVLYQLWLDLNCYSDVIILRWSLVLRQFRAKIPCDLNMHEMFVERCRVKPWSFGSTIIIMWKFPSPTWPTIGERSWYRSTRALEASTHSANRLIGTQTSVGKPLAPGRRASAAQYAWCLAFHSFSRSSGLAVQLNSDPPA